MPHSTAEEGAALTAWYQTLLMGSLRSEALESALADLPRPCPAAWPADFLLWLVLKSYSVWPDCPDLLTLFAPAARPGLLQQTGLIVYLPEITPAARQRLLTALKDELPDLQTESAAETWAELAVALSASGASAAADALWLALQQHALKKGPRQKTWTVLTYLLCNSRTHWPPVLQHWRRQWPRQHARKLAFLEATVYDLNWLTLCTFQLQPELEPLRPALDALVQLLWRGLQQLQAATPTTEALALDASRLQQRLLGQAIHWELPCAKAWLDTLGYTTPLDWLSDTHQLWEHQDLLTPLTAAEQARLARALPDPDAETDTASSRWQLLACLAQSHLPIAPTAEAQSLAPLSTRHLKARWRHLQAELAQL